MFIFFEALRIRWERNVRHAELSITTKPVHVLPLRAIVRPRPAVTSRPTASLILIKRAMLRVPESEKTRQQSLETLELTDQHATHVLDLPLNRVQPFRACNTRIQHNVRLLPTVLQSRIRRNV